MAVREALSNLGGSTHVVQWQIRDTVQKSDPASATIGGVVSLEKLSERSG